jgi:hypothetical protein
MGLASDEAAGPVRRRPAGGRFRWRVVLVDPRRGGRCCAGVLRPSWWLAYRQRVAAREAEHAAIAARADQQHTWVLAGDDRGVYGAYPIPRGVPECRAEWSAFDITDQFGVPPVPATRNPLTAGNNNGPTLPAECGRVRGKRAGARVPTWPRMHECQGRLTASRGLIGTGHAPWPSPGDRYNAAPDAT